MRTLTRLQQTTQQLAQTAKQRLENLDLTRVRQVLTTKPDRLTRMQLLTTAGALAVAGITVPVVANAGDDETTQAPIAAPAVVQQVPSLAAAPSVPSDAELHPVAVTAKQVTLNDSLDAEQKRNAEAIIDAGQDLNLPARAWEIAIATSLQESNLHNIGDLGASNDHDSLGLFQQRPSTGWGTADQLTDPTYAATAFYEGTDNNRGLTDVDGWQTMPLTVAAQKVQVSAYPDHYAKHETEAADIIKSVLTN